MPFMKFTKMHGLGNDYVYVNGFHEHVESPAVLARLVSDRHTGIGGDGLILIQPSSSADVRMEMYNADGSRSEMCGNGIRCVAKYAVEHGLVAGPIVRIETDAGLRSTECRLVDGKVDTVRVDMGKPSLASESIPTTIDKQQIISHRVRIEDTEFDMTCVSMGNPHAIIFVADPDSVVLEHIGPIIECHSAFPKRINVHFARVDSPSHVTIRTWERGSGITRACGTGACAVCVAGVVTERTGRRITATLSGGDLEIEWADDDHVYMSGPAVVSFSGVWPT